MIIINDAIKHVQKLIHITQLNGLKSNQLGMLLTEKNDTHIKANPTIIILIYKFLILFWPPYPCGILERIHEVLLLIHQPTQDF